MKQKSFFRLILFFFILLAASLACNFVTDFFVEGSEPYYVEEPTPVEIEPRPADPSKHDPDTERLSCPAVTERILETATELDEKDPGSESEGELEGLYLITYSVSGNQISDPIYYEDVSAELKPYQNDHVSHQEIWDYFVTLIPAGERISLAEYSIVTDGEGEVLAAVTQTLYDPALWSLEVDMRDSDDKLDLTYTLIHEFAHLLTLGPNQVTPSEALFDNPDDNDIFYDEVTACPNYFPGEGCSHSDSYINAFFDQFWLDIYGEWLDINLIDDDSYYEALDDFYYDYEDRFLTGYAATNPEEDIAEAFTFFVLSPRPNGDTITEQKVLFFYRYTELIQLRDEILRGVCQRNK